jgi:flagellar protein FliT
MQYMQEERLIDSYQSISNLTGEMVNAASEGNWDGLTELEQTCRAKVDQLRNLKEGLMMNSSDKKQKVEVIKKILADDARIRELTEPWMNSLHSILSANYKGKLVTKAYKQDDKAD